MKVECKQPLLTKSSISLTTNPNLTITASSLLSTGLTRLLYLVGLSRYSMRCCSRLLGASFAALTPEEENHSNQLRK